MSLRLIQPQTWKPSQSEGCSARKDNMTISLAFLAPISSRQPSKDGCLAAWELLASAICLPIGHGNTRCLASLPRKCDSRTGLCLLQSPYPGNAISRPENKARNTPLSRIHPRQRIVLAANPANWGLFAARGEISGIAECVVGPGGLEPPTRPL